MVMVKALCDDDAMPLTLGPGNCLSNLAPLSGQCRGRQSEQCSSQVRSSTEIISKLPGLVPSFAVQSEQPSSNEIVQVLQQSISWGGLLRMDMSYLWCHARSSCHTD